VIYQNVKRAVFINRPNRFIAHIEIDGRIETCHVKNTGRCRELLIHRAGVIVQEAGRGGPGMPPGRKTKSDLISVYKSRRLINIDSQPPNKVFAEWLRTGGLFHDITLIKPEYRFGSSRFDFYIEAGGRRALVEVKGVTLEESGVTRFPDAPTERGVKHVRELAACVDAGFDAYVIFIVQMKDVLYVEPNWSTHRAFGKALREAAGRGVRVLTLDCHVTGDSITAGDPVEVRI